MGNSHQAYYLKNDKFVKYGAFLTFSIWMAYCNFKLIYLIPL